MTLKGVSKLIHLFCFSKRFRYGYSQIIKADAYLDTTFKRGKIQGL